MLLPYEVLDMNYVSGYNVQKGAGDKNEIF